jgi:hypothetical protein
MSELLKSAILGQFQAALSMLDDCIRACPAEHWDGLIAKYPFWMVAYHTLCFADLYLTRTEADFKPGPMHPRGMDELEEEYPSRRFTKEEILGYVAACRDKLDKTIASESAKSLAGHSGHPRRKLSRAELHIYNLRHVQHHAGQLGAFLRRVGVDTSWVGSGRK